jgi:peptidoglycan-associated lipoprotein
MRRLSVTLAALLLLPACSSKAPETAPVPEVAPTTSTGPDTAAIAARRRADSLARVAEAERLAREAAERRRIETAIRDTLFMRVHFDFDQAELRPEDQAILDRKLAILRSNPSLALKISGHCDERGSDEYNLALGNRRAEAVRTYLVTHGVAPDRLRAISYGEERPLIAQETEWAWAQNRRGEFEILTGPVDLVTP